MAHRSRFAFNVVMNWAATAIGMLIPFFLTPQVLKHLGPAAYGVWILAVSTVSYLSLLDLGLRSAVIRFVSKADAEGDEGAIRRTIGAALWFRLLIAGGVALLSIPLAFAFPHLFNVPRELHQASQITVLLCAFGIATTLVSGVFGAVLSAIHRFDLLSSVTIAQTVARALGILTILHFGLGLVSLAICDFSVLAISALLLSAITLKIFPAARVSLRRPDRETIAALSSYSLTMFVIIVAGQIIFNTDTMVVGAFLSVGQVAFYSIGASLIAYSGQVVSSMSTTFAPMASNLAASGRFDELRRFLIRGTRATLALALPISITLLLRGKTFISLWMGAQYGPVSGTVLQILIISQFFTVANTTASAIMFAMGNHKPVARVAAFEAVFNLALSLILVKTVGMYGVAWGTSISMGLVHLFFWPRYVRRILGVPIRSFLWRGWSEVTLCALPFAMATYLVDRHWHPASLLTFFLQIAATLPLYALFAGWAFRSEILARLRNYRPNLFQRPDLA